MLGVLSGRTVAEAAPIAHWACFGSGAEPLPRYWRLVASERPPVDRAVRLYERGPDGADVNGQACRVEYDKRGETRVLWSADNQRAYCRPHAERLVARLSAGGFSCVMLDDSDRLQQEGRAPSGTGSVPGSS